MTERPINKRGSQSWPEPLSNAAFYGLPGEVVATIEPHSESDPAALLLQFLLFFGNIIGRTAHFAAEADRHYTNENLVLVGETSKGRKGTALGHIRRIFKALDADWAENRITDGLVSGEGLIWAIRDPVGDDGGASDKRLLVIETEMASTLDSMSRHGNTLSAVLRNAWDSLDTLTTLAKHAGCKASDPHISIIGHITRDELRSKLREVEKANGFGNRFLWACVRRSKCLPEGGDLQDEDLADLGERVSGAVEFARSVGLIERDRNARRLWIDRYEDLSEGKPGILGAMVSRAEAHVMRLACIYAVLDYSYEIEKPHLEAAFAVWRYCEDSARYIFGDALGDATADEILSALRQEPEGLSRTDIRDHFSRNKTKGEISSAIDLLELNGLVRRETIPTSGRPAACWVAK